MQISEVFAKTQKYDGSGHRGHGMKFGVQGPALNSQLYSPGTVPSAPMLPGFHLLWNLALYLQAQNLQ